MSALEKEILANLKHYPHYPRPDIIFHDVMPLLGNVKVRDKIVGAFCQRAEKYEVDAIVSPESRGFLFGTLVAQAMHLPFVPVRKPHKLPGEVWQESYQLEYGEDSLEIQQGASAYGKRFLFIDDLAATMGTTVACSKLVQKIGGEVLAAFFVIRLTEVPAAPLDFPLESLVELPR